MATADLKGRLRVGAAMRMLRKHNAVELMTYTREQWVQLAAMESKGAKGDRLKEILNLLLSLNDGQLTLLKARLS